MNDTLELISKIGQGGLGGAAVCILYFAVKGYQALQEAIVHLHRINEALRHGNHRQEEILTRLNGHGELLHDVSRDIIRLQGHLHHGAP